jgi:exopolyphosphatase/guanosine-5'-triphosphate,3'-diphosphate pyrophosphatase
MRKAVLDVGSNSVLLLVAEHRADGWHPIHEATAVTALGEGTKATGLLGEPGMSRTLDALREMFATARSLGVENIQAGATMAARIAQNTPEFLAKAEAQGTPVFVVSGEQEAQLGFEAVANDPMFADVDRISIVDPGGHSTELVTAVRQGEGWDVRFRRSYPVGTLGLKSQGLGEESPDRFAVFEASNAIDDLIGLCYLPEQAGKVIVLGAAGTNLITIRERMPLWEPEKVHGQYLDYEEVGRAVGWMMPMTDAERAAIVGMEKGREKTIHLGALVLERFLYALRTLGCYVSVRGWRYALLDREL